MITVMGATGNTGRKITKLLLDAGEEVLALGRSPEKLAELAALGARTVAGDVRDARYLASTFVGADAVYTLTAFDPTLPDYHADQDRRGEAIVEALRESGVRHVVALSSIGAELSGGNGFVASLHRQEQRLSALDGVDVMLLRPGAFFEGFHATLETIRHEGVVADSVVPDTKVPMVATADIARAAAGALRERNWNGVVVRELLGPRDLTYAEVTAAIGAAIGRPDLAYVQLPDEELVAILTGTAGFSPDFVALFVEFNQALSDGRLHSLEGRNASNTTPTGFEEFAVELAHAYAAEV
ncbi:NAD(P)H-binding protein [Micromonospora sp. NBRC 101691]|uniref:NAD(P)H-binding protein n=1 Tax=Micromonospora sp. NBRC 101691 TaxID=3032198 RepID=UPI002553DCEF|nr:NAD(P)H-binding protein [Micromonospora sp. NBRC 101691]